MFDGAGIDITGVQAIVPNVGAVLDAARDAGVSIVYLKMGFRATAADLIASLRAAAAVPT